MHSHFPGNVGKNAMAVVQLYPEHGVGQGLYHRSFNRNHFLFSHKTRFPRNPVDSYRVRPSPFLMNPS